MTRLPESTEDFQAGSELMLLPDGRILAHHLTPEMAFVIRQVAGVAELADPNAELPVPGPS